MYQLRELRVVLHHLNYQNWTKDIKEPAKRVRSRRQRTMEPVNNIPEITIKEEQLDWPLVPRKRPCRSSARTTPRQMDQSQESKNKFNSNGKVKTEGKVNQQVGQPIKSPSSEEKKSPVAQRRRGGRQKTVNKNPKMADSKEKTADIDVKPIQTTNANQEKKTRKRKQYESPPDGVSTRAKRKRVNPRDFTHLIDDEGIKKEPDDKPAINDFSSQGPENIENVDFKDDSRNYNVQDNVDYNETGQTSENFDDKAQETSDKGADPHFIVEEAEDNINIKEELIEVNSVENLVEPEEEQRVVEDKQPRMKSLDEIISDVFDKKLPEIDKGLHFIVNQTMNERRRIERRRLLTIENRRRKFERMMVNNLMGIKIWLKQLQRKTTMADAATQTDDFCDDSGADSSFSSLALKIDEDVEGEDYVLDLVSEKMEDSGNLVEKGGDNGISSVNEVSNGVNCINEIPGGNNPNEVPSHDNNFTENFTTLSNAPLELNPDKSFLKIKSAMEVSDRNDLQGRTSDDEVEILYVRSPKKVPIKMSPDHHHHQPEKPLENSKETSFEVSGISQSLDVSVGSPNDFSHSIFQRLGDRLEPPVTSRSPIKAPEKFVDNPPPEPLTNNELQRELIERHNRAKNFVITGFRHTKNPAEELSRFIWVKMKISADIKGVIRSGNKLVATVGSAEVQRMIIAKKGTLRGTSVYFEADYTGRELKVQTWLEKEAARKKKTGRIVRLGYQKIKIDSQWWFWNEIEGRLSRSLFRPEMIPMQY
uniref:Uncharacterized protein n=1 Tax=Bracon brevicornis TaxID=1563983 RepID=A0A6V7K5H5_9HYME